MHVDDKLKQIAHVFLKKSEVVLNVLLKDSSLNIKMFPMYLYFFALKQREKHKLIVICIKYAMILLVRPTWHQIRLYVAPELQWVWHPWYT